MYLFSSFWVVILDQMCRLLTLRFCCNTSVMANFFSFENVLNTAKAHIPQKKRDKKWLVKVASLSQGASNSHSTGISSQAILNEAILSLLIVLAESTPQAVGASNDPVRVFSKKGSNVEDDLPIAGQLNRKRNASTDPIDVGIQTRADEDLLTVREVLVIFVPHHGLDVPRKEISCPSLLRASLLINRDYGHMVA